MNVLRDAGYLKLALVGLETAGGKTMNAFALICRKSVDFPDGCSTGVTILRRTRPIVGAVAFWYARHLSNRTFSRRSP